MLSTACEVVLPGHVVVLSHNDRLHMQCRVCREHETGRAASTAQSRVSDQCAARAHEDITVVRAAARASPYDEAHMVTVERECLILTWLQIV